MSISWNVSLPRRLVPTCPDIMTRGDESINAVAIPVTAFVAPGPDVITHTPVFPEVLAYPSAAWTAPCSCDVLICFILSV